MSQLFDKFVDQLGLFWYLLFSKSFKVIEIRMLILLEFKEFHEWDERDFQAKGFLVWFPFQSINQGRASRVLKPVSAFKVSM